ncbi:MAG: hypothetical protein V9E81_17065 [Marmoricola sp.]
MVFALACVAVLVIGLRAPATTIGTTGFFDRGVVLDHQQGVFAAVRALALPLAVLASTAVARPHHLAVHRNGVLRRGVVVPGGFTASATSSAPDPAYLFAIGIRVVGEIYLMSMIVRDLYRGPNFERTSHGKLALPM